MLIHFLRHAETTGDIEQRYGGDYEDHLSEHGKEQVESRIKRLPKIKRIISSPRVRAEETAEIIAQHLNLPVHTEREWRDRNTYGILTGMLKSEAQAQYPGYVDLLKDYNNTLPEAEPYEEFKTRILAALEELAQQQTGDVLVVTHGRAITCISREIVKAEIQEIHPCAMLSLQRGMHDWRFAGADGVVFATAPPANNTAKKTAPPFDSWRGSVY